MYTTQGLMTSQDLADYRAETDTGSTTVYLADPPAWFTAPVECPVCGAPLSEDTHEAVRVTDASGTIYGCLIWDGAWLYVDGADS